MKTKEELLKELIELFEIGPDTYMENLLKYALGFDKEENNTK